MTGKTWRNFLSSHRLQGPGIPQGWPPRRPLANSCPHRMLNTSQVVVRGVGGIRRRHDFQKWLRPRTESHQNQNELRKNLISRVCSRTSWAQLLTLHSPFVRKMSMFEACQGPALAPVDNIFARIARKEEPADIVYEDDTVIAFKDSHPVAPCHLLIVPKMGAVRNPSHLTVQHVDLLEHMVAVGKQLLKERAGLTPNQQTAQASLGFHMPPWTIVPHLHMHAIAPLRHLRLWQRLHFLVGSFWYQSAEKILERLKSQQTTQLTL